MTDRENIHAAYLMDHAHHISPGAVSFISTILLGYAVHLFAFSNLIPNIDGLSRIYDEQNMLMSGRWFLHIASYFHGFVEAPAWIGALSLFFLACSAFLITGLLELSSALGGMLVGAFLVVNIAWAYTYTFIFTASAYAFAILLAVISVYLVFRTKRGVVTGGVILAFSLGIYQAYLSVALTLALFCFLLHLNKKGGRGSKEQRSERAAGSMGSGRLFLRLASMFLISVVLYLLILVVCLRRSGTSLSDYRGMNSFGEGSTLRSILSQIAYVYVDFFRYLFTGKGITLHSRCWIVLNALTACAILLLLARTLLPRNRGENNRRTGASIVWLALGLLFFPFAINFPSFLNPSSLWMRFAFCFYYIYPVMLADHLYAAGDMVTGQKRRRIADMPKGILLALMLASLLFHAQYANTVYTALDLAHKATQSFLTTMVARIQGTEGYRSDMEVIIIGTPDAQLYQNGVPELKQIRTSASSADNVLSETKHIYYYLNDWLGVNWHQPTEEEFIEVSDSETFQSMPIYPDDGSVVIQEDKVIVKLSDHYQPKKSYELQFEEIQGQGPWR